MSRTNNIATGIKGTRQGPPVECESEHFMDCEVCGQSFDMRDLGEVFHHASEEHEPLKAN